MKIIILWITLILFAFPAWAATYTWEDDQGVVNFTEDLGKVPPKYRKKVKIVGEEELVPSEPADAADTTSPAVPTQRSGGGKQGAATTQQNDDKTVYGDKELSAWKQEYGVLDADVKAAEKQLVENRIRLKDTSGMSRSDYLSIQATIRSIEDTLVTRRQKRENLKQQATEAGVPAGSLE